MSRQAYDKTNKELIPIAGLDIIDDALSSTSTHAVQNRVVTSFVGKKLAAQTLAVGATTVTFNDASIVANCTIEPYTNVWGVNPTSIEVTNGQAVLTFAAQENAVSVYIIVR